MQFDDAKRKSDKRAAERDLKIPRIADLRRRKRCLADTYLFLHTYFPAIFTQPFTADRREMVDAIEHAAKYGGDQAVAGPRGDGKTRSALFVTLKLMLMGALRFPLIISKSGPRASRELRNFKDAIRASELLLADFPEVVGPVVALGGWASRARQQTVFGQFTNLEWGEECVIFPTILTETLRKNGWNRGVESSARGQVMASLGIEGPIRGYVVRNERPDLAILDDIDDRESARSELQTSTRSDIIEQDVGGLAGPDKTIARVMLCTKINRTCIAAIFTDKKIKPSWRGQCHKLLVKLPDRMDLWEEYIALRQGRNDDDPDARKAHEFYLANRAAMEAGSVVTNPFRFDARPLVDGEPGQVSALQACFDLIADRTWDHFNTEYQNDPPNTDAISKSGLTKELIQKRLSGLERGQLPPDCKIVVGIDLGKRSCHWVAGAFRKGGIGNIVNYGIIEVTGAEDTEEQELIQRAILRSLLNWRDEMAANPFLDVDGHPVPIDKVLIDSGYCPEAVYELVRRYGDPFRATKGIDEGRFQHGKPSSTRIVGNFWFATPQPSGIWLYQPNVDHWKRSVHERFLTEPLDDDARPRHGSLTIFVPAGKRDHHTFAAHIMAEEYITEFVHGKGEKNRRVAHSANNHFYDAAGLMLCGAEQAGFGVFAPEQSVQKRPAVISAGRSNQSRW